MVWLHTETDQTRWTLHNVLKRFTKYWQFLMAKVAVAILSFTLIIFVNPMLIFMKSDQSMINFS